MIKLEKKGEGMCLSDKSGDCMPILALKAESDGRRDGALFY